MQSLFKQRQGWRLPQDSKVHPIVFSPEPLKVGHLNSRGVGNATKWDIHSTPVHEGMWALRLRDMVITKLPQELEAKDSTSKISLPIANSTFTVRLLTTCRIPGYRGHTVKAQVEGDWSQVQGKEFLFEPDRETLQKFELDAESSLVKCDSTIALRVHNYSYSATFIGKDMVLGTVEPCELVPTGHSQGSGSEQGEEKAKVITGQVDIATPTLLTQLWINPELPEEVQLKVKDHLIMSADIFALDDTQLGVTTVVEHSIDTGEAKPIKQRPWRTPLAYREKVVTMIGDMLARGGDTLSEFMGQPCCVSDQERRLTPLLCRLSAIKCQHP